jgi:hypothetical protein
MASYNKNLPISLQWYASEPKRDEWLIHTSPVWAAEIRTQENLDKKDLEKWAEEQVKTDVRRGYLEVKNVDFNKITYSFDVQKWLKDNFLRRPDIRYNAPRTLIWKWKKRLPDTILSHSSWIAVSKFLEDKFKNFLKRHHKKVFKEKMKFLSKVNYGWFDYEADMDKNTFVVKLKYSVMIALAVGAKAAKDVFLGK